MSRSILGKIRSALCLLAVAVLVAATPGSECYAAAGRAFEAPSAGAEAARFVPGVRASTAEVRRLAAPFMSATLPGVALLPGAVSSSHEAAPAALNAASVPPAVDLDKKEGVSLSEGARQDFMKRVAPYYKEVASSSDDVVWDYASGGFGGARSGALAASRAKKGDKKPKVDGPARDADGRGTLLFGSGLLGLSALSASTGGPASALFFYVASLFSMLRHEMAHARKADALGGAGATLDSRLSWKPKDLLGHVDLVLTVLLPIVSYRAFGLPMASLKAVDAKEESLGTNVRDQSIAKARVAWAGPRENLILALGGVLAFAALGALGVGGVAAGAVRVFTTLNVMLGLTNLLPVYPLDGRFILRGLLHKAGLGNVAEAMESIYRSAPKWFELFMSSGMRVKNAQLAAKILGTLIALAPAAALMSLARLAVHLHWLPTFSALIYKATSLLLNGAPVKGLQLASAGSLPGMAALATMLGWGKPEAEPKAPEAEHAVDFIVVLNGAKKPLAKDMHIASVDVEAFNGARKYEQAKEEMHRHISDATENKLSREALSSYNAIPVATYKRINAATLRVDASRAGEFMALLESQGHKVYADERRAAVDLAAQTPEENSRNLKRAAEPNTVRRLARKIWGAPGAFGKAALMVLGLVGAAAAQPPVAVISTGIKEAHPFLRGIPAPKNATGFENSDDSGVGTQVTAELRAGAPWLNALTHYKAFVNGTASLDGLLRAATMAANDGHIVILDGARRAAGGSDAPDALMSRKLAEEGRVVIPAADAAAARRAGGLVLLCMLFGVKTVGAKLDKIAARYDAAAKSAGQGFDPDEEALQAAYSALAKEMKPVRSNFVGRLALKVMGSLGPAR